MKQMQTVVVSMESLAEIIELQLKNGGRANLTVTGSSMVPMLCNRRDSVSLVPAAGQEKTGDVILYRRKNGQYILHRIIAQAGKGYVCCGDNQYERESVAREQLIAVVDGFVRNKKEYTLEHKGYRFYTTLCVKLFFMRKIYITLRRSLGRLRRKLFC